MTRHPRKASDSGWYHVTMRGAGRRSLFESDDDRDGFLQDMGSVMHRSEGSVQIPVWCLMDNHIHLVVKANTLPALQKCMHRLCSGYAIRFNKENGHVGPVFQERFASFPIQSDAYLIEAVRYVHLNCRDKGIDDPADYPWSSYPRFMSGPRTPTIKEVIEVFGSIDELKRAHSAKVDLGLDASPVHRRRLNDDEARRIARIECGSDFAERIPLMESEGRNRSIARLYAIGLSTRQLERLTGIGRGTIRRICHLK